MNKIQITKLGILKHHITDTNSIQFTDLPYQNMKNILRIFENLTKDVLSVTVWYLRSYSLPISCTFTVIALSRKTTISLQIKLKRSL